LGKKGFQEKCKPPLEAPTPFFALSLSWEIALPRLHLSDPATDGIL